MAENTVASWGGLEIQLVSEDVVNVINTVKGALELVNEFLSIGLQIAEVAKTFVTSNLDLARAAIKELIALLRGLIQDLLNVGLFANFADLETLKRNKAGLKGGYDGWERRMITRLNDRNDPNRPNFSESTTVIALFVYVGVPDYKLFVGQYFNKKYFDPIIQSINAFKALFGYATGGSNDGLPIAVNLHTEYASPTGTTSQDVSLVASSFAGNSRVKVVWNSTPAPGGSDQDPNPQPPSSGYIVEVSCYPHGFQAGWIAPSTAGTGSSVPGAGTSDQAYTTGQYMTATTGRTLTIFGGEDSINLLPEVAWPDGYVPGHGTLPAGHTPLYFYTDPSAPDPIIKAFGKSADGTYYNQRSFYVPQLSVFTQMLSGANYTFELKKEELPKFCPIENGRIDTGHAEDPQTVYVRVIPVTSRITEDNFNQARWTPRPRHDDSASLVSIVCPSGNAEPPLGNDDFGTPSEVLEVAIPNENQNLYAKAIQTAIAILVLSRSDLMPPDPVAENAPPATDATFHPTGLEIFATEVFRWMDIQNPTDYFSRRRVSPESFVQDLYPRIVEQADRYLRTQGTLPPSVLNAMAPTFHALVDWMWSDSEVSGARANESLNYTILESLNPKNPINTPLASNRYCTKNYYSGTTNTIVLGGLLAKWLGSGLGASFHPGSLDTAPVIGPSDGAFPTYWFARQMIPESLYLKARMVLGITSDQSARNTSPRGSWQATKPFSVRAPTGRLLTILDKVDGFLNVLLAGAQKGADAILRFISFLEQRVREIQELIKRIEGLLDIPFLIPFPEAKALLLITNGTAGVVTGLLQSEEKPTEGAGAYACGAAVIAGGSVPRVLIELLSAGIQNASGD